MWRAGKTPYSEKTMAEPLGKRHFAFIAQTGAVRKEVRLRVTVPRGGPLPLRLDVKVSRSDSVKG